MALKELNVFELALGSCGLEEGGRCCEASGHFITKVARMDCYQQLNFADA